jgi:phenylpyruvate tautomerase PptA (4-oxalocrotonate tautomerase family)
MPVCFIEGPTGIGDEAKMKMMKNITAALNEAFHIDDIRFFLREYLADQVAQDGRTSEPVRPVCSINVPYVRSIDVKRKLIEQLHVAVAEGYKDLANTRETLIFVNQYELENVGLTGTLQSDRPKIVDLIERTNSVSA